MTEIYLYLDGITGESQAVDRVGEIEVKEWSWGMANPAPFGLSEKKQASVAVVQKMKIEKIFDKSSPTLAQFCTTGKHIPQGILTCYKLAGDQRLIYLSINLIDVMIKSIVWPSKGEHNINNETVELDFSSFDIGYTLQSNTGEAAGNVDVHFDISGHNGKEG